jgi:GAF domain-containing protein
MSAEESRISALRDYHLLDTPPDEVFDRITDIAALSFEAPISLVSLVDRNRVWFKARHGLDVKEIPRVPGLCSNAILSDDVYIVSDAATDPRTVDNPLVCGPLGLRFYAAAPLITPEGHRIGTLNVIDVRPRSFSEKDARLLKMLAGSVVDHIEVRLAARQAVGSLSKVLTGIKHPEELVNLITVCAWTKKIRIGGRWITFDEFIRDELGLQITHGMTPEALAQITKPE